MKIELTHEQERTMQQGQPVEIIDPQTQRIYYLIAREAFERNRPLPEHMDPAGPHCLTPGKPSQEILPGIKRSQEALRRDLPKLLENKKLLHQWAAYHGDVRIGIARSKVKLLRECIRRGISDAEYYIGWIDPTELIEEEELPPRLAELGDINDESNGP